MSVLCVLLFAVTSSPIIAAAATTQTIPIRLSSDFLVHAITQSVFTEADGSARVWDDGSGCNDLTLREPQIELIKGRLKLRVRAHAHIGQSISSESCLSVLDWRGYIESWQEAYISDDKKRVQFRVVDSQVYDDTLQKRVTSELLWTWARRYAHPAMEQMTFDLRDLVDDTRRLLLEFVRGEDNSGLEYVLDSLRLSQLTINNNEVVVDLSVATGSATHQPNATQSDKDLTDVASVDDFNNLWRAWDGFVTHAVRQSALTVENESERQALLDLMLSARHGLNDLLNSSSSRKNAGLRQLFSDTWTELAPFLRAASDQQSPSTTLRFASFITAGDILGAIDTRGSEFGIELSVEGLRRLALALPTTTLNEFDENQETTSADPVEYRVNVDANLRELFGFGPPLPPPEPVEGLNEGDDTAPLGLLDWFVAPAQADVQVDNRLLVPRLNRWIVTPNNARRYVPLVDRLLDQTMNAILAEVKMEREFRDIFEPMLAATAWQESCYRQFVAFKGRRKPLLSTAGAVGLMQVRPVVWRGFYEPSYLENDISYNAAAGAEILLRFFERYAIAKNEHKQRGGLQNLAGATYAAYNGGPRRLTRYRDPEASTRAKRVDAAFASKFKAIRDGQRFAPITCFGLKIPVTMNDA